MVKAYINEYFILIQGVKKLSASEHIAFVMPNNEINLVENQK